MQKGDDPGKFRQLDEIIFIDGYPGYQHLSLIAEKSMQVVCDLKGNLLSIYSNEDLINNASSLGYY